MSTSVKGYSNKVTIKVSALNWLCVKSPAKPYPWIAVTKLSSEQAADIQEVMEALDNLGADREYDRLELVSSDTPKQIVSVGGLEMFALPRDLPLDTPSDPTELLACPFCGHAAAYHDRGRIGTHPLHVECSNTSCGIRTPKHYASRETAAQAWNRRTTTIEDNT